MTPAAAEPDTLADILHALGDIPPDRVLMCNLGRATEADVLRTRHAELVDGMLVLKAAGMFKGLVEAVIGVRMFGHVIAAGLGVVTMASGPHRLAPGLVRRPDAAFTRWHRLLDDAGKVPDIAPTAPDVVVEVLAPDSPPAELTRKYRELFAAGAELVWEVDPATRTVAVYTAPDDHTVLTDADTLTGRSVLPGFALPLAELFDDPQLNPRPDHQPPG